MFTSLVAFALAASSVMAGTPTENLGARATAAADCTTKFVGILSANNSGTIKSFELNSANQVAYIGTGTAPLVAQFQTCKSLQSSNQVPNTQTGRLFVPSQGKCIGTTDYTNATAPYYTTLVKCGTDASQRFQVYTAKNNAIYYYGATKNDGTFSQGGCGMLGYKATTDGTPIITHTKEQITLECSSKAPFYLASRAA